LNIRTTIILLVVFAALGSYYFFVERGKPTEEEKARLERTVLKLDRDKIDALDLSYGGDDIRCEKEDGQWEMLRPVRAKADETAIAGLLAEISKIEADRILEGQEAGTPEQFGLDNPMVQMAVTTSDPPDSHWVAIGDETPTGDAYYSFVDERDRVVLIPSSTVDASFKKKPFDLRDKTVMGFDVGQVVGIELSHDNVTLRAERRKGGPWTLVEPMKAKGDDTEINSVLFDLENAKVREFLDETPQDLSIYGLDKPAATVKLWVGAANTISSIDFGKETEEGGTVYARRSGYSNVVKVDKRLLDKVKKDFADLRQKRLMEFATSDVAAIAITMRDSLFSCVRDSSGDWTAVVPESKPLKKWKMNGVSSQLSSLRAFSFVDEPKPDLAAMGLVKPQVKVTITLTDSSAAGLEIGAVEGDEVYVRAGGEIAKVSADFLKDLTKLVRNPPYVEEAEEKGDE
jgi:hypothetical protein